MRTAKKLVMLLCSIVLFCSACSKKDVHYLSPEELRNTLTGTWRVMYTNGNHFATYVFVDQSHYYEIKGEDYYGYLEPYTIDLMQEKTAQGADETSKNIGKIEMINYKLDGSSSVLPFSYFYEQGKNSLTCKITKNVYVFQKFSDDATDKSKGDIFVAIDNKKSGKTSSTSSNSKKTAKSSSSSLSGDKQKVTCSMCNGTGQVKYYYGEGSSQYNLGPCTSCDGKGYTMMTVKGSSDNGKNVICPGCGKYVKSLESRKDKAGVTRRWCKNCWKEYDDIMG